MGMSVRYDWLVTERVGGVLYCVRAMHSTFWVLKRVTAVEVSCVLTA